MSSEQLTSISQEIVETFVQDSAIAHSINERTPIETFEITQTVISEAENLNTGAQTRDAFVASTVEALEDAGLLDNARAAKRDIALGRQAQVRIAKMAMRSELQKKFGIGRIL